MNHPIQQEVVDHILQEDLKMKINPDGTLFILNQGHLMIISQNGIFTLLKNNLQLENESVKNSSIKVCYYKK